MKQLPKTRYHDALPSLHEVTFNCLFARAVVERCVDGEIHVDEPDKPSTFYVVHPYGMSLLYGRTDNEEFNAALRAHALDRTGNRTRDHWMQAYPDEWHTVLADLFDGYAVAADEEEDGGENARVVVHTRVNFRFDRERYLRFRRELDDGSLSIARTDRYAFEQMRGRVVPRSFWNRAGEFVARGVGFSAFDAGELVATAFSAFIFPGVLEIGIETVQRHRGRGHAVRACAALLDYCLDHGYEPIWSCSLTNRGSHRLAERLGFVPTLQVPYYRLRA